MIIKSSRFKSVLRMRTRFLVTKHFSFASLQLLPQFLRISLSSSPAAMTDTALKLPVDENENLLDYDEEDAEPEQQANGAEAGAEKKAVKGNYVSIHSSGFRDFLLKPELLRAIVDCGFEHPSEGKKLASLLPPFFCHTMYECQVIDLSFFFTCSSR